MKNTQERKIKHRTCKVCGTAVSNPRYFGHCDVCWMQAVPPEWKKRFPAPKEKLPKEPTDAMPGTEEKVRVLEERAKNNEPLWHPDDAGMDPLREELNEINIELVYIFDKTDHLLDFPRRVDGLRDGDEL